MTWLMTWSRIMSERPERLEVDDVQALRFDSSAPLPLKVTAPGVRYMLWHDLDDVAYWREDVWLERPDVKAGLA